MKNIKITRYVSKYFPPIIDKYNIDFNKLVENNNKIQKDMKKNKTWYEDGFNYNFRKATNKCIALGKYHYYIEFSDYLYETYNKRFYLLDYMTRLNDDYGDSGLLYYILSAEEIHINLKGIPYKELKRAINYKKIAKNLKELKAKNTTTWEINQVVYNNLLNITTFYIDENKYNNKIIKCFKNKINENQIKIIKKPL